MKKELDLIETLEHALEHVQTLIDLYKGKKEIDKFDKANICKINLEKFIDFANEEINSKED
jgi:hypothetical protein